MRQTLENYLKINNYKFPDLKKKKDANAFLKCYILGLNRSAFW